MEQYPYACCKINDKVYYVIPDIAFCPVCFNNATDYNFPIVDTGTQQYHPLTCGHGYLNRWRKKDSYKYDWKYTVDVDGKYMPYAMKMIRKMRELESAQGPGSLCQFCAGNYQIELYGGNLYMEWSTLRAEADNYYDNVNDDMISINYCPFCGKKLEEYMFYGCDKDRPITRKWYNSKQIPHHLYRSNFKTIMIMSMEEYRLHQQFYSDVDRTEE